MRNQRKQWEIQTKGFQIVSHCCSACAANISKTIDEIREISTIPLLPLSAYPIEKPKSLHFCAWPREFPPEILIPTFECFRIAHGGTVRIIYLIDKPANTIHSAGTWFAFETTGDWSLRAHLYVTYYIVFIMEIISPALPLLRILLKNLRALFSAGFLPEILIPTSAPTWEYCTRLWDRTNNLANR